MSKAPTLTTISSGYYSSTALTSNFQAIVTAFENTLSLDGSTPNAMGADIDLNDNDLLNVGTLDVSNISLQGTALTTSNLASVAPWAWRDAWSTSTAYILNDLVRQDGNVYICVTEHTAGTFATDLSDGRWNLFASKGTSGSGSGDLVAANNLDDLDNVSTARTNLGLRPGTEIQPYNADLDGKGVTGSDSDVVTGTQGTTDNLAKWNTDGDLVDGPAYGESGASKLLQLTSAGEIPAALLPSAASYRTLLQTEVVSGTSAVELTSFDNSTYSRYEVEIDDVYLGTSNTMSIRTSTDGGTSYDDGSGTYYHSGIQAAQTFMRFPGTSFSGSSSVGGLCTTLVITGAADSVYTKVYSQGLVYTDSSGYAVSESWSGLRRSAAVVDAIRFAPFGGSITGTFRLYGVNS